MVDRISSEYEEGISLGDLGYSNLISGSFVSKGSAFSAVYSSVEWLQNSITQFLSSKDSDLLETPDIQFLYWLNDGLFALSSFCYRKGNTEEKYNLMFPHEALTFMLARIKHFKAREGEVSGEFIRLGGSINKIRIQTRDVERHFVAWRDEPEIIKESRTCDNVHDNILRQQKFLNRASSYFYWLARYQSIKDGGTHTEWITRVPDFEISLH